MLNIQSTWSQELGLATSPLFGASDRRLAHSVMLDGIAGSFVFSDATAKSGFDNDARHLGSNWSWSSMMRHHVLLEQDQVVVSFSNTRGAQEISRASVDRDLSGFLAYLERSNSSNDDVVDHVIGSFQSLRSVCAGNANEQLTAFLALISLRLSNEQSGVANLPDMLDQLEVVASEFDLSAESLIAAKIDKRIAARFFEGLLTDSKNGRALNIDLTVRHAGAELFQAAQLVPAPPQNQGQLFGLPDVRISVRPHSLKGVAYTPIGLARILAEQSVSMRLRDGMASLTVADYACGSGSFLTEAIAALGRLGWSGNLQLIGYDVSPTAVTSTKFAIACAKRDHPNISVKSLVEQRDFLCPDFEPVASDIVLMNPPYQSWLDMDKSQHDRLRTVLGDAYRNRPDLSIAFVERALNAAKPGAILTNLLPVGVVAGESAAAWRAGVLKKATPRLIAVLGDHTLFRFATVNVAAVMLEKGTDLDGADAGARMIWASETTGAASAALRQLRREPSAVAPRNGISSQPWSVYRLATDEIADRANWLPAPRLLAPQAFEKLRQIETRIDDLFDIKTGIRAGDRHSLIISESDLKKLPKSERSGFRPVAEKQDIAGGVINSSSYYFDAGNDVESEAELKTKFPRYFEMRLEHGKEFLAGRRRAGERWWLPSEARNSWRQSTEPRIVSRQWVKNDGFAVDERGAFAVVQGYAWFPRRRLKLYATRFNDVDYLVETLRLYCVLFSSDVFFQVAREYSTNSSGGQINLQQNLIKKIPVPLIPELMVTTPWLGSEVANWGGVFPDLDTRNQFAARCYGFDSSVLD
jgi:adenine-specific DNA-methyltransferase